MHDSSAHGPVGVAGPGGANLELSKKAEKSMGSLYNMQKGDDSEGTWHRDVSLHADHRAFAPTTC